MRLRSVAAATTAAIIIALKSTAPAHANWLLDLCGRALSPAPTQAEVSPLYLELHERLANADAEVNALLKDRSYITKVGENLDPESFNGGAYKAETPDGNGILKIHINEFTLEEQKHVFVLQNFLADRRRAPRIRAIIPLAPGEALGDSDRGTARLAVVMDEIPHAWNFAKVAPRPLFLWKWDRNDILSQISEISEMLKELWVFPGDLQVTIAADGRAWLIDFDFFNLVYVKDHADGPRGTVRGTILKEVGATNDSSYVSAIRLVKQFIPIGRPDSIEHWERKLRPEIDQAFAQILTSLHAFFRFADSGSMVYPPRPR